MRVKYEVVNEQSGYCPDGKSQFMILALYVDDVLVSRERVTRPSIDDPWDFNEEILMGDYLAFDVYAYAYGEDRAFWDFEEDCLEPCWFYPKEKIDITPTVELYSVIFIRTFSDYHRRWA